jgi:hypothetical protein
LRRYEQDTSENLGAEAIAQTKKLVREDRPAAEVEQGLRDVRRKVAATKYPREYKTPLGVEPFLPAVADAEVRPILNSARKTAVFERAYDRVKDIDNLINLNQVARGSTPEELQQYLAKHPQTISAGAMDTLQTALSDASRNLQAKNPRGARGLADRAREIGDLLDHVPELKDARATYRVHSEMIDSFQKGAEFLKGGASFENRQEFEALNKGAKQTARIGARQALHDALESNSVQTLRRIESNRQTKSAIAMMFGSSEAERYARAASYRLEKLANAGGAAGGAAKTEGAAVGFLTTSPVHAAKHAMLKGVEGAAKGMSEKEAQAIASLGSSKARPLPKARPDPIRRKAGKRLRRAIGVGVSNVSGYDQ